VSISRRTFVTTAAATGTGLLMVPRHVLGRGHEAPGDLVSFATDIVRERRSPNYNDLLTREYRTGW
jgi:hypothetical protein